MDDAGLRCRAGRSAGDFGKYSRIGVAQKAGALPVGGDDESAVERTELVLHLRVLAQPVHVEHRAVRVPDHSNREGAELVVHGSVDRLRDHVRQKSCLCKCGRRHVEHGRDLSRCGQHAGHRDDLGVGAQQRLFVGVQRVHVQLLHPLRDRVLLAGAGPLKIEASDGTAFQISLPSGESSADAVISPDGAATYDHQDGSASVVLVNPDSSVRIASVLDGEDSPTQIEYNYNGLRLVQFEDGGVVGYDVNGTLAVTVAIPWALDANGAAVDTWYTVDGSTLTQHVTHRAPGVVYPVVADPVNYGGNFMYTQILHEAVSQGITIAVYPAAINFSRYTNDTIFANYAATVPSNYEQQKYRDQLICHVWNVGRVKMPWNLDSWRPNVGYNATVLALCNP